MIMSSFKGELALFCDRVFGRSPTGSCCTDNFTLAAAVEVVADVISDSVSWTKIETRSYCRNG